MVFNSALVTTVATMSADLCQYITCNPQRLSSQEVLDVIFCLPLQQLGRLALCFFSFICFPMPASDRYYYYYRYSDSSSSSSSSDDSYYSGYDSNSD